MFAQNLKRLMDESGMLPIRLAATLAENGCTVTEQTVNGWLKGICLPRLETAKAVAAVFHVTIDAMLTGSDPCPSPASR